MTANPFPTALIEWAPGYGPFDASPVFVPFPASDVLEVGWQEGRSKGLEDFPPATGYVVLKNDSRKYDPDNTAGAFFGQLLPYVPVRCTMTRSGTFQQFTMYVVDGWEQQPAHPSSMTCRLTLIDKLGVLAGLPLPGSAYKQAVLADDPLGYWPMDEAQGATAMQDLSAGMRDGQHVNVDLGRPPLTNDKSTSAGYVDGATSYSRAPLVLTGSAKTFELMLRPGLYDAGVFGLLPYSPSLVVTDQDRVTFLQSAVTLTRTPAAVVVQVMAAGVVASAISSSGTIPGQTNHIVLQIGATSHDVSLWVDGLQVPIPIFSGASNPFGSSGLRYAYVDTFGVNVVDASAGHLAIYEGAVGATVALHAEVARESWAGDFTGERAIRVLDALGVPSSGYDIDTGNTVLGPADLTGDGLDYLRKVARTEQGDLRTLGHDGGKIAMSDRYARYYDTRSTVSQGSIGDDGSAVPFEKDGLVIEPNGVRNIVNTATVSFDGGSVTVSHSSAYGPRGAPNIDTMAPDPFWARGLAEWVIAGKETPVTQLRALKLKPSAAAGAWPLALGTRIGDRLTFTYKALNTGSRVTRDYWVEGRSVAVKGRSLYEVTLMLSPVIQQTWFTWDVSRWDVDATWAY